METIRKSLLKLEIKIPILVDHLLYKSPLLFEVGLCRKGNDINVDSTQISSETEHHIVKILSGNIDNYYTNSLLLCWMYSINDDVVSLERAVDDIIDKKNNTISSLAIMLRGDYYFRRGNEVLAKHDYLWALNLSAKRYKDPIRYRLFLLCGYSYKLKNGYRSYIVMLIKNYENDIPTLHKKLVNYHGNNSFL